MNHTLRPATDSDYTFAFEAKQRALGPHISARWGWQSDVQARFHRQRWAERPWCIIELDGRSIGTVSVERTATEMRFGEFYLLPEHQGRGIGSAVLQGVLAEADASALTVNLEYLKWNPVGSLYKRHGFVVTKENDSHYFLSRPPMNEA